MEYITFMHQHQPLLSSGMTPFGWHTFIQESIRTVTKSSKVTLKMPNGISIQEVIQQAFIQLGDNSGAQNHSCSESTKKLLIESWVMTLLLCLVLMKTINACSGRRGCRIGCSKMLLVLD
jgi:hypothetical protein